jgi:hypothetical protein
MGASDLGYRRQSAEIKLILVIAGVNGRKTELCRLLPQRMRPDAILSLEPERFCAGVSKQARR